MHRIIQNIKARIVVKVSVLFIGIQKKYRCNFDAMTSPHPALHHIQAICSSSPDYLLHSILLSHVTYREAQHATVLALTWALVLSGMLLLFVSRCHFFVFSWILVFCIPHSPTLCNGFWLCVLYSLWELSLGPTTVSWHYKMPVGLNLLHCYYIWLNFSYCYWQWFRLSFSLVFYWICVSSLCSKYLPASFLSSWLWLSPI